MNIILEFDGVIADQQESWYAAHTAATQDVGWSRLDSATFWRLMRTRGRQADLLPAAKPIKLTEYWTKFDQLVESDEWVGKLTIDDDCNATIMALSRHGDLRLVTLGANLEARQKLLVKRGLARFFKQFEKLDLDPRRRPAELKLLSKTDPRTIVASASDALVRSSGSAELVTVGISTGSCTGPRLHQAGASVVYKELAELAQSLQTGARDLIQAGLLPRSLEAPLN
jgi:phosphoglycolate phosphatase-like HAD superfamily hydrolase